MARKAITRIHVNQNVIRSNRRHGTNNPPIGVIRGREKTYSNSVDILGESRLVYAPDKPLACGARLWIETEAEVVCR